MLFKEIVGHQKIKKQLIDGANKNRVPHAQLFVGNSGSAKLAIAFAYSQFLNCENKQEKDSCNACASCLRFKSLTHPDLHLIFPILKNSKTKITISDTIIDKWREKALKNPYLSLNDWIETIDSTNKTGKKGAIYKDEALNIQKKIGLKNYEAKYRIVLVWMPETMNLESANKLLKTFEEPPKGTVFLLISEDEKKLLKTVRSRFQKVKVPDFSQEEVLEYFKAKSISEDQVKKTISFLGVDLGSIIKSIEKSDDEIDFFPLFSEWMRLCYKIDIEGICKWVDFICAEGRQRQKQFISYSTKMIRDCLIYNFANHTLLKVTNQEKNFLEKFAPFVNEENTIIIAEQLERAGVNLERNGSSKILFFELSLQMTKNLKLKRKFVKK